MSLAQQLNDDILLLIFCHLNENSRLSLRSALIISHVCVHWRTLAVNHCPEVWRVHALRIPKPKKQYALMKSGKLTNFNKEMVRRSQDLGLEFGRDEIMPHSAGIAGILRECSEKIGWMSLTCPTDWSGLHALIKQMTTARVPRLKHLELSSFPNDLPSTIFRGDLSSLVSLELSRCWVNLQDMDIGEKLKTLTSSRPTPPNPARERKTNFPIYIGTWIPILQKLPQLTSLELELVADITVDEQSTMPSSPSLSVTLPHLTQLDVTICFDDLWHLAENISLPACRQIRIVVPRKVRVLQPERASRLTSCIKQLVTRHVQPSASGSRLRIVEDRDFVERKTFILSPIETPDVWDEPISTTHNIYLSLHIDAMERMLDGWLAIQSHIKAISLPLVLPDSGFVVLDVVGQVTSLRTLRCTDAALGVLLAAEELQGPGVGGGLMDRPGLDIDIVRL